MKVINTNSQLKHNNTNFNSMYGVGKYWDKLYSVEKEAETLTNFFEDLSKKKILFQSHDAVSSHFECDGNDIFFIKEKEHIKANLKCVSKSDEDRGFFIINDTPDNYIRSVFDIISSKLEKTIKKSPKNFDRLI